MAEQQSKYSWGSIEQHIEMANKMLQEIPEWNTAHAIGELIAACRLQQEEINQQNKEIEGLWKRINSMDND